MWRPDLDFLGQKVFGAQLDGRGIRVDYVTSEAGSGAAMMFLESSCSGR